MEWKFVETVIVGTVFLGPPLKGIDNMFQHPFEMPPPAATKPPVNYTTLVVLNDGETYSTVTGCSMIVVDDAALERINNGESLKDIPVILEIGLTEYHPKYGVPV